MTAAIDAGSMPGSALLLSGLPRARIAFAVATSRPGVKTWMIRTLAAAQASASAFGSSNSVDHRTALSRSPIVRSFRAPPEHPFWGVARGGSNAITGAAAGGGSDLDGDAPLERDGLALGPAAPLGPSVTQAHAVSATSSRGTAPRTLIRSASIIAVP